MHMPLSVRSYCTYSSGSSRQVQRGGRLGEEPVHPRVLPVVDPDRAAEELQPVRPLVPHRVERLQHVVEAPQLPQRGQRAPVGRVLPRPRGDPGQHDPPPGRHVSRLPSCPGSSPGPGRPMATPTYSVCGVVRAPLGRPVDQHVGPLARWRRRRSARPRRPSTAPTRRAAPRRRARGRGPAAGRGRRSTNTARLRYGAAAARALVTPSTRSTSGTGDRAPRVLEAPARASRRPGSGPARPGPAARAPTPRSRGQKLSRSVQPSSRSSVWNSATSPPRSRRAAASRRGEGRLARAGRPVDRHHPHPPEPRRRPHDPAPGRRTARCPRRATLPGRTVDPASRRLGSLSAAWRAEGIQDLGEVNRGRGSVGRRAG